MSQTHIGHTIPEDQWLPNLGNGDWRFETEAGYPDLVLDPLQRQALVDWAAQMFVEWVLEGTEIEISHDADPSWDCSGYAEKREAGTEALLARHVTLGEWMEDEYTGDSTATFVSGMGLAWSTYGDYIRDELNGRLVEIWLAQVSPELCESAAEVDGYFDINLEVERALYLLIARTPTAKAWQQQEAQVRAEQQAEAEEAARRASERHEQLARARQFWQNYFGNLSEQRIERAEWRRLGLEKRLKELLADADPMVVNAIAAVGLPGNFSNSIFSEIQTIARKAEND